MATFYRSLASTSTFHPKLFLKATIARPFIAPANTLTVSGIRSFHHATATRGPGNPFEATDKDFDQIMKKEGKDGKQVLVDFYADWCGPCKILGPIIQRAAAAEGVSLVKVNTDAYSILAQKYGITGLPTVFSFKNGKKVGEFVGVRDEKFVRNFIKENA